MERWGRHKYQPCLPLGEDGRRVTGSAAHIKLSRKAAAEGSVLLKNEVLSGSGDTVLPLKAGTRAVLLGKGTFDYVKGGAGSGDVTVAYERSLANAMMMKGAEGKVQLHMETLKFYEENIKEQRKEIPAPGFAREPELPEELLKKASKFSDTAIVTFSRISGEAIDRMVDLEAYSKYDGEKLPIADLVAYIYERGDFYLTKAEEKLLKQATENFAKVIVVLNVGGVVDTFRYKDDSKIGAVLLSYQGGIEGGLAIADVLCGDSYPSGKLTDTFAKDLTDYPSTADFNESFDYVNYTEDIFVGYRFFETVPGAYDKVVYPFGFGLTYTVFEICEKGSQTDGDTVTFEFEVKNVGKRVGREVVQVYLEAPQGVLGKAKRVLAGFKKTRELNPRDKETIEISFDIKDFASFDDTGKIAETAWVLEKGTYRFWFGNSIRDVSESDLKYECAEDKVVRQEIRRLAPSKLPRRLRADGTYEDAPKGEGKIKDSCLERLTYREAEGTVPAERAVPLRKLFGNKEKLLAQVDSGEISLDEFMEQLSVDDMINLLGGKRRVGVADTFGIGDLIEYGVPEIMTADGPAGLRIPKGVGVCTTAWPCATLLASTFDPEIVYAVGKAAALEVKENNIGIWLAPAANIHRNPLCGRNFEYYSEDPLLAGKIGAAMVSGIQSQKIAATVKHFALNNKEVNRKNCDSRASERAIREVYLKVFEIIVKESEPWCVMTSYNRINGVRSSENDELINGILRGEWGFDGVVMTDWWALGEQYLEIKAGNDLKMGNGYDARVKEAYEKGEISFDEIRAACKNILKLILRLE